MQTLGLRTKFAMCAVVALMPAVGCSTKGAKGPETETAQPPSEPAAPETVTRPQTPEEDQPRNAGAGAGLAAIASAAAEGRYLFVFFQKHDDEQTRKMRHVLDMALKSVVDRAGSVVVDVSDPNEREVVEKYGVHRAPMPLVLVLAPNGAVTGGFPFRFKESQLVGALAGPGAAGALKALQDGKLVLVCIQNEKTLLNDAAMRGVKDFVSDAEHAKSTEVVTLDPTDAAELKFLGQIGVDPKTENATTVLLAPPGTIAGTFEGATDKAKLVSALQASAAGCGTPGST